MKRNNDLKFLIIFIIVVAISLLYLSQASYAKYRKQVTGRMDATVASWNILVNNEDIKNKTTLTNSITPVFDSNQYVKTGVIAPGSTGYFDITIDATNVDVDFTYEIQSSVDETTPLEDIVFTKYEKDGVEGAFTQTGKITDEKQKNTGTTSLRIYFKWNDDSTNNMDNQEDTEYASTTAYANTKIKIVIHFAQKNQ